MEVKTQIKIDAPKEKVWQVISDIENAVNNIEAIEEIEILEKPENGLIGLKWREVRTMFGKKATEVMWITHSEENHFYQTRAESHGSVYVSRVSVEDHDGSTLLTMGFKGEAQTFMAKLMSGLLGSMFKNATIKALNKDLEDIKTLAES